jgi:hypothetical protein
MAPGRAVIAGHADAAPAGRRDPRAAVRKVKPVAVAAAPVAAARGLALVRGLSRPSRPGPNRYGPNR